MFAPSRSPLLLAPPLAVALIAATARDVVSPDGPEMVAAGRCLWRAWPESCLGAEPMLWPPAFPLISSAFSLLLPLEAAARTTSTLAAGLSLLPLMAIAAWGGGRWAALAVPVLFAAVPALRVHAVAGDARSLALLGLLGAWACALGKPDRRRDLAAGAFAALAVLARFEAVVGAALLVAWRAWDGRPADRGAWRRWIPGWMLLSLGLPLLPWWGALSLSAGYPAVQSRGWISRIYEQLSVIPHDWILQELGPGSYGTPLRAALSTAELSTVPVQPFDLADSARWLAGAIVEIAPPWLLALAALGGWTLRRYPRPLVAAGLLGAPSLVIALLPQYHDDVVPANNLLPALVSLLILAANGVEWLAWRFRPAAAAALLVALLALGLRRPYAEGFRSPQVFAAAAAWLAENTDPGTAVASTIAGAPIVRGADRPRRVIPMPWSVGAWMGGPDRAEIVVITNLDTPAVNETLRALAGAGALEMVAYVPGEAEWAAIFAVEAAPGAAPR